MSSASDLEAVEIAGRRAAFRLVARSVEAHLNNDHTDHLGPFAPCPSCAAPARYVERRTKSFTSALGVLTLERAYYTCESCHAGFFPRDQVLGLVGSSLTPSVTRMIAVVGASCSFEEGSQLLSELADVSVSPKTVERYAERMGEEVARDEVTDREGIEAQVVEGIAYAGFDGTGIPVRKEETEGREGKQEDCACQSPPVQKYRTTSVGVVAVLLPSC